jgi:hypothetical protein
VLDEQFGAREYVLCGFVEYETQRADIDAVPRSCTGIEEFDVAILIESELEALRHVVDFGTDDREGQLNVVLELLIDVYERATLRETLGHVVVLAAYL